MKTRAFRLAAIVCIAAGAPKATSAPILELTVTPEPGATAIVLAVSNDNGERRDILGFHIYRAEFTGVLREGCAHIVRVNDDFLPRQFGNSSYSFQVEDDALVEGRAYQYYLEGYPSVTSGPSLGERIRRREELGARHHGTSLDRREHARLGLRRTDDRAPLRHRL